MSVVLLLFQLLAKGKLFSQVVFELVVHVDSAISFGLKLAQFLNHIRTCHIRVSLHHVHVMIHVAVLLNEVTAISINSVELQENQV